MSYIRCFSHPLFISHCHHAFPLFSVVLSLPCRPTLPAGKSLQRTAGEISMALDEFVLVIDVFMNATNLGHVFVLVL